jgi:hypothetical protein
MADPRKWNHRIGMSTRLGGPVPIKPKPSARTIRKALLQAECDEWNRRYRAKILRDEEEKPLK